MSKKKALPDDVDDFFEGESIFFRPPQPAQPTASPQQQNQKMPKVESAFSIPAAKPENIRSSKQSVKAATKPESLRIQKSVVSNRGEENLPQHDGTMTPTTVELVRKAVKRVGKEAATYRFTPEEKQHLADIVYTYNRQGYRTSENEITRIAVNWLLWDYQEQGEQSVLARLLRALHE